MKKIICFLFTLWGLGGYAQEKIVVYQGNARIFQTETANMSQITFSGGNSIFSLQNGENQNLLTASIDSVIFVNQSLDDKVRIIWNENGATVENPYATQGISVTTSGATVTISANTALENVEYELSGSSENGCITLASNKDIILYINNLQLISQTKAAVKISSQISSQIVLQGANSLSSTVANSLTTSGAFIFSGNGSLEISTSVADVKGIKADNNLIFNSGTYKINVSGSQSKGISSNRNIVFNNGNFTVNTSGDAVLTPSGSGYDPSYCTAIKADSAVHIFGGTINIVTANTAKGGKGISADGDVIIKSGNINISTAGNGATYTNSTGTADSYTAACIKSNGNIQLLGGTIACSSSGTGGKGISADGSITIGNAGADDNYLTLNVSTSGERFLVSGSTGGGGGRPGGGGGQNTANYANPKAIKATGNLTVNSGTIRINCTQTQQGGEGMESKAALTINGGDIEVRSYDDPINGGTAVTINGGKIYAAARGNDAIDSNGTLAINGGIVVANGIKGDGEGIDSDYNYTIGGGILLATSGSTMCSPLGPQKAIKYSAAKAGQAICIKNAAGETIVMYNVPIITNAASGATLVLVFSDPRLVSGTYTLLYGGTISGGTNYNGYVTGGTYAGGSTKSFTVSSSALVTVN